MKAILIDVINKEVRDIVIHDEEDFREQAYDHINCNMIEGVYFDHTGKNLGYVDENGLLKESNYFFNIEGGSQPYAGNCLIIGDDGEGGNTDTTLSVDEVRKMVRFLGVQEVDKLFA